MGQLRHQRLPGARGIVKRARKLILFGIGACLLIASAGAGAHYLLLSKGYVSIRLSTGYVPNFSVRPAILPSGHTIVVERLGDGGPIITRRMFADLGVAAEGDNINGPAVVAVPAWLPPERRAHPSANYYMYFARHGKDTVGDYIRLAWAEDPAGPWHLSRIGKDVPIGQRGVLDLGPDEEIPIDANERLVRSVGSPDVVVDHANRRFVMYFHALRANGPAAAFVATSADGLDFNAPQAHRRDGHGIRSTPIGRSYLRTFEHEGRVYAFSNFGFLYRSPEMGPAGQAQDIWKAPWEFTDGPIRESHDGTGDGDGDRLERMDNPRHFAVQGVERGFLVLFSRRDDAPERILASLVFPAKGDWKTWRATFPPIAILEPELPWEGAGLPIRPSRTGMSTNERALRDPYLFVDEDGSWYLYYTGRGERAIGVVRLTIIPPEIGDGTSY